ncbi:hypothetical protein ACWDOR_36450 [Streptosporangium canum]
MTVWAYARASTRDQNPQLQLDALEQLSTRIPLLPFGTPARSF